MKKTGFNLLREISVMDYNHDMRLFFDTSPISTREVTPEGYLKVKARAGRVGTQAYLPGVDIPRDELPVELRDRDSVNLLRPEDEVFSEESLKSFALKPVTLDHPPEDVTAVNVRKYQVGLLLDAVREKDDVLASLVVQDADAIRAIDAGKTQVSLGYSARVDWETSGEGYDGVFRDIRGNHIAIVDAARAGSAYRLLDSAGAEGGFEMTEKKKIKDEETKEKKPVEDENEAGEVETLKAQLQAALARIAELESQVEDEEKKEVEDEDEDEKKEEEIEKRIADGVRERLAVVDAARRVWKDAPTSGGNTAIRLAVIDHLTGGKSTVDRGNPAVVAAVFDALVSMPKIKTEQLESAAPMAIADSEKSRAGMMARRRGEVA